jgi:hypothetical protein
MEGKREVKGARDEGEWVLRIWLKGGQSIECSMDFHVFHQRL